MSLSLRAGDKIKIISLKDEPTDHYTGRVGTIEEIKRDCYGDVQLWGTWGGVAVYPRHDQIEKIS